MTDHALPIAANLRGLDHDAWLAALEDVVEAHGTFTPLGRDHAATFLDAGPKLLVTFENAAEVRALPDALPRGFAYARQDGWSHLGIISHTESWFRDVAIYRHIDRLIDDGFFEDFEDVLFYGAQAGGYGAAAYSVAAPGARVLALAPQATLEARIAAWDQRFVTHRRVSFADRYGYAPDMIDAARQVWIAYNPQQRLDAMHAALFTRANVQMLRARGLNGRLDTVLDTLGALEPTIRAAMAGTLTPELFTELTSGRKTFAGYRRLLVRRARETGHVALAAGLCRRFLSEGRDPYWARQLDEMGMPADPDPATPH
ncbi:hypothetical protein SAMN04488003_101315 [Loktanella fryxellensis]|uniref:Phosphoadenosine phosphosulfate reductase n=1 Tax=Loktanella fryxellensis TaxID=245187 RepID=A0A1H7YUW5_9RHOB|nr:hypothetical protein [Loktanella fryxellensis]SEM49654.1 hypothetical protein SAMN04488003_101315 [Loktanella fryxellensis]